jgi:hypothetical protein
MMAIMDSSSSNPKCLKTSDKVPGGTAAANEPQHGFVGSMRGTLEIVGDVISPMDVKWEAEGD